MDRRKFLRSTGMAMVAVTLLPRKGYTFNTGEAAGILSCIPTTADILGPFYRANAPFRNDLQVSGDPGTTLVFKGKVLDENCDPIANALVDVWHADDAGAYDNTSPAFEYRGRQYTDAGGEYQFLSILPGAYLNGAQYRPKHIHFRVTAPGFTELITQLYFEGDPYIPADPWASVPAASLRIVPIEDDNGTDTAVFDITLNSPLGLDGLETDEKVTVIPEGNGFVRIKLAGQIIQNAELMDVSGRLISTLYKVNSEECRFYLPENQVYFVRLDTGKKILVHKLTK